MKAKTLNRHLNAGHTRALAEHEEPLAAALEQVFVKAGDAAARRFEASAVDHLTAAAPAPTATMIACYPSPEEAVALAQPNGELASILHVTLAYLGEIDPDQAEAAVAVVQQVATEYGPLEGIVGGIAAFGATESSDGLSPSIVLPDVPGLAELRQGVCDALEAAGIDYATNHGWQPHLTLVYTEEPQPPPVYTLGLPLTFDRLTVARGDVPRDFPLGALTASGGPADWSAPHPDEVVDVAALVSQIRARNDEVRRAAVAAAMTPALEKAGLDFDVTNPLVGAVLARSGQHVTDVAETTRLNVMRTIRESYEQGLSIPDTATAIRAGMTAAAPARARLIARTELARVVNGGAIATVRIVGEAAGVTYEKSWLVAEGAEYPRHEEYDGLDGQTVGLDEQFDVGGYPADYPGDESLPPDEGLGCRCTTIAVEAGSGAESEGPDGVVAALSSADEPILGGHVKRSTVRTRQRRAAHTQARRETNGAVAREELAQLADRALGTAPASVFERRRAAREALTAAGVVQPDLLATYPLTHGSLTERFFYDAALKAGYTELGGDWWPTEAAALQDDPSIVCRDGDRRAVYLLDDGTLALVMVDWGECNVRVAAPSREAGQEVCATFRQRYPASYLVEGEETRVPITFWTLGAMGPVPRLRKIDAPMWAEIEGNYPATLRGDLASMMAWENGPAVDGQLLLLQGEPGTGKTYVLRALAQEWASWAEFNYITDPDAFFVKDPSYMVNVLLADSYGAIERASGDVYEETDPEGKWRVLILEDTGELLAANAKEAYGQGLSRLLNVVDGMIGQGLKVLAIVTTNDELGDLHPAVKRDGRCAVSLEFGAFPAEEASEWLGETVEEDLTIAQLYARRSGTETAPAPFAVEDEQSAPAGAAASKPSDFVHVEFDTTSDPSGMTTEDFENVGRFVFDLAATEVFNRDLHARIERGELTADAAMELYQDRLDREMTEQVVALGAEKGRTLDRERVLAAVRTRRAMKANNLDIEGQEALAVDPSLLADAAAPTEVAPRDERVPRAETPAPPEVAPTVNASQVRWEATLVVEGTLTEDGRYIEPNATTWRELPLTLMAMLETSEGGHVGAEVAGRIDEIWRGEANPDGSVPIFGRGVFDDSEFGREVARMVEERVLRGNSVDLAVRGFELAYPSDFDESGHRLPEGEGESREEVDPLDAIFGEKLVFVFTDCVIGMSTVCPFPAFRDAQISLAASGGFVWTYVRPSNMVLYAAAAPPALSASAERLAVSEDDRRLADWHADRMGYEDSRGVRFIHGEAGDQGAVGPAGEAVTASAAGLVPLFPPGEWFENPELEELTPLTVTDDGRVYGHLAEWDTCHIGIPGVCTTAPRTATNYSYFHLGEVETDTGDRVSCGKITLDTNHADLKLGWKAASAHYDNTGTAVADVVVGEDEHGIWFTGALRPDVPAERIRELSASPPSGDWRGIRGNLELVGVLSVNVPGFPVPRPRASVVASGEQLQVTALTAAGIHNGIPMAERLSDADRARLETLAAQADGTLAALADLAAEAA